MKPTSTCLFVFWSRCRAIECALLPCNSPQYTPMPTHPVTRCQSLAGRGGLILNLGLLPPGPSVWISIFEGITPT
ncbi:hypothetical protein FB451DRAFT_1207074, partial [Mycena latifolia]